MQDRESTRAAIEEHKASIADRNHVVHLLGMVDVAETEDTLTIEMPVGPTVRNVRGALQGGLVATLIDIAAGRLAMAGAPPGHSTATTDMTVHYLLPIVAGPARATARILRRGRRTVVLQVDVVDVARDRLAATATLQFIVLENTV